MSTKMKIQSSLSLGVLLTVVAFNLGCRLPPRFIRHTCDCSCHQPALETTQLDYGGKGPKTTPDNVAPSTTPKPPSKTSRTRNPGKQIVDPVAPFAKAPKLQPPASVVDLKRETTIKSPPTTESKTETIPEPLTEQPESESKISAETLPESGLTVATEREIGDLEEAWNLDNLNVLPESDLEVIEADSPDLDETAHGNALAKDSGDIKVNGEGELESPVQQVQRTSNANLGPVDSPIVLHAKVVAPLIRPLPIDVRQAAGRNMKPAKPVGYQRDTNDVQLNGSNVNPLLSPKLPEPMLNIPLEPQLECPLLPEFNDIEDATKTADSVTSTIEGITLRAIPSASEFHFRKLPSNEEQLIIKNQIASPSEPSKNR